LWEAAAGERYGYCRRIFHRCRLGCGGGLELWREKVKSRTMPIREACSFKGGGKPSKGEAVEQGVHLPE
jgi:hypothetical protein